MNITSEELLKEARALEPQLQQWRRTLHRHPEVGFDLPHTKELVKKALTEMGYEPKDCGIDVLTIPVHFIQCWACEQPSLGPRMATSQGLVVRIEQVQIRRVEGLA